MNPGHPPRQDGALPLSYLPVNNSVLEFCRTTSKTPQCQANILFFNNTWKLADLGLARFRNEDVEIDSPTEIVGPIGWLSPEAVNRAFANRGDQAFAADIDISDASDVFQLGKLFWYILYGSLPTGQLDAMDCATQGMFASVFSPMLQYSKQRRASITRVEAAFKPILSSYGI